jgi:hypothetical protein
VNGSMRLLPGGKGTGRYDTVSFGRTGTKKNGLRRGRFY